jgi:hypothetical protein
MRHMRQRDRWWGIPALVLAALAAATLTASAYWPGLMTWDPVRQYGEALSGDIDDWHPPAMQWLWARLLVFHPGPMPMLVMQLALYWGGLTLIAAAAWRAARPRLAWALLACGLLPLGLALTGAILKDCLMAGALLVATGLLAPALLRGSDKQGHPILRVLAAALLFFAATLRFNGFTACLPLLVVLLPATWRNSYARLLLTTVGATAALMAAMPLANRLIGAKPSGVELSLILFDLGGITEHSGNNVFPPQLDVADPVQVNHRCYRPNKWDSYSDWVDPECPLGFSAWNDEVAPAGVKPYPWWLRAVAAHPVAWAQHRFAHFAINTRLMPLPDAVERPVPIAPAPNPWGFGTTPGPLLAAIDALAVGSAHTPLGWPIVWMAVGLGALLCARGLPAERLVVPLALSSLFYGGGYLVFSVAAELRYHLWTELAALLATVLVVADYRAVSHSRLALAYAPTLMVVLAALAFRL